jgi:cell division protein FtsQ
MWDNPRLLNAAAGFLVGLVALACVLAATHWLLRSPLFPVRAIELATPLRQASRQAVEAALESRGNFFAVDLAELRAGLERLPWVRRASVRRAWPDRIEVALEEHVALARWGNEGLVNVHGERFAGQSDADLPLFVGPPGTEGEIARRYARYSELVAPLGSPIERVVLSQRYAWQLTLASGMQITLGRDADAAERRLARFIEAYVERAQPNPHLNLNVDLRYPNGFALRQRG